VKYPVQKILLSSESEFFSEKFMKSNNVQLDLKKNIFDLYLEFTYNRVINENNKKNIKLYEFAKMVQNKNLLFALDFNEKMVLPHPVFARSYNFDFRFKPTTNAVLSNDNLTATTSSSVYSLSVDTPFPKEGKYYWEIKIDKYGASYNLYMGVMKKNNTTWVGGSDNSWAILVSSSSGSTYRGTKSNKKRKRI
jgi:hypothetical protein